MLFCDPNSLPTSNTQLATHQPLMTLGEEERELARGGKEHLDGDSKVRSTQRKTEVIKGRQAFPLGTKPSHPGFCGQDHA